MFRKEVSHVWAQEPTGSGGGLLFDEGVTIQLTCVTVAIFHHGETKGIGQEDQAAEVH